MNRDFAEMLSALSAAGAEYLIVGAHALAAHGRPRATGDLDIWVRPTEENAHKVWAALARFGAPLSALKREDLSTPGRRPSAAARRKKSWPRRRCCLVPCNAPPRHTGKAAAVERAAPDLILGR